MKKLNPAEIETVQAYADNDMVFTRTAKQLRCSHQTIRWRLRQVKRKTGLDPTNFYDLQMLVQLLEGGK